MSHGVLSVAFVCVQAPVTTSQPSVVQGFVSAQFGPEVATHWPAEQWSPIEQSLPSLQVFVSTLLCTQPVVGSQPSFVHCLLSLQLIVAPGMHTPFWQVSPAVQAEPSLQVLVLSAVNLQPLIGSQVSSVQGLPSSHTSGEPAVQVVPLQVSAPLHTLPSEHPVPAATAEWLQVPDAVQASCVQGLVSAQLLHAPPPLPHLASTLPIWQLVPSQQP